MQTTIKLTNLQVYIATKALETLKISGQPSFARRRFLRDLKFFIADLEAERKELINKLAEKKGDELKIDNNEYVFNAKNKKVHTREFDALNNESVQIDITDANKEDIITVSTLLSNEATRIETDPKNKDGLVADMFDYVEHLKEISSILNYAK